jgi:hypothetical protein
MGQKQSVYHSVKYEYKCVECGTSICEVDEMCEEVFTTPVIINGDLHYHDRNRGFVKLICKNGHETEQKYIPACSCGWSGY